MQKVALGMSVCVSSSRRSAKITPRFPIAIPTNQSFVKQWRQWVIKKVSRHFKRSKERIPDTVQNVFVRLLAKDVIGRWFFKHLTDELVDRTQAEKMLGGAQLMFISNVSPVEGRRADPNSIWRVSDLLTYAKFNYERYYYSIQDHTIDSEKVLRLLGYPSDDVATLESLYRQGHLRPSELTEHNCTERRDTVRDAVPHDGHCKHEDCLGKAARTISLGYCNNHGSHRECTELGCGKKHFSRGYCNVHYSRSKKASCQACDHGRGLLASRGLSLNHRWDSPDSREAAMKLRWNDSQLKDFLRDWRRQNMVKSPPDHIMRPSLNQGIDAGLLAYVLMVIDNAVVNDFKTLTRSDDVQNMVFNDGQSPELSNAETVAWEGDSADEGGERIMRDTSSLISFHEMEHKYDAERLASEAGLTPEELRVVAGVDIADQSIRDYADSIGRTIQQVHKVRNAALAKMRSVEGIDLSEAVMGEVAQEVCTRHGVTYSEMMGPALHGVPVLARTDFFAALHQRGMFSTNIAARLQVPVERVVAAINRARRRENALSTLTQASAD